MSKRKGKLVNVNKMIGRLDRCLSQLKIVAKNRKRYDEADVASVKHHAEDAIEMGTRVLNLLGATVSLAASPHGSKATMQVIDDPVPDLRTMADTIDTKLDDNQEGKDMTAEQIRQNIHLLLRLAQSKGLVVRVSKPDDPMFYFLNSIDGIVEIAVG